MKIIINIYDFFRKPKKKSDGFSAAQLEQIQLGREAGLSEGQIQHYAKPDMDAFQMWDLREQMEFCVDVPFLIEKYYPPVREGVRTKYSGWVATMGGICGDIAGSRYEFSNCDRKGIRFEAAITEHSRITDDTVMMLATLEAVREVDTDLELKQLLDIHENNFTDASLPFGDTAYSKKYKKYFNLFPAVGYGGGFWTWGLTGKEPYKSYGNGSAMRVAPIGEFFENPENVILHAVASAACTHNHPEGIKGAVVTAVCIWMGKHGYSKDEILGYVKTHYENQKLIQRYTMKEVRSCKQGGYGVACQFTVPAAVVCFVESEIYEGCIENALSFEGDSDTIGAIAGAMAAAYYGSVSDKVKGIVFERLPEALRGILEKMI